MEEYNWTSDSTNYPAKLQDEGRWTWNKVADELREIMRQDFPQWEAEQEDFWKGGCKS